MTNPKQIAGEERTLLEMAARAAGLEIDKAPDNGGGADNDGFDFLGNAMLDWHNDVRWNPLTDDADAFRLAVKLYLDVDLPRAFVYGRGIAVPIREDCDHDALGATRLAITRAAASIGASMKEQA